VGRACDWTPGLLPCGLRLDELTDGAERPVLADAHFDVHPPRLHAGGHAHAVESVTGDADADVGHHRHAPRPDADSGVGIDADHRDADARARDPHADRSGSDGDACYARTHEHAVRGHADTDAPLNRLTLAA
jgi:hypothetical protein